MNARVVQGRGPRQQAADAIERAEQLIADIPGFYGYELDPETDLDLRAATVLAQRATAYLCAAAGREEPRLRAIEADCEARGERLPWDRDNKRVREDGD
ncbi:MAG: hypothetical protein ACRD3Q_04205 [Terriglobales bacterium]